MMLRPAAVTLSALVLLAAGARPQVSLDTVRVASGVTSPVFVCAPPGDPARVFIVQKNGHIRILKNGAVLPTSFLNIQTLVSTGSEQGLLGLAFHPNYAQNGRYFVNYTNTGGSTVIARYQVSSNPDISNTTATILMTISQPYSNHNGGCIQFGPDGYLYIGMGDGGSGNDPQANGQNINVPLGKMLRIDVDSAENGNYGTPSTNPFDGAIPGDDRIWAYGLRNPWRFSFDRATGNMVIADVGQNAWEEIDFEPAGAGGRNYGWRCMEGNSCTGLSGCTCNATTLTNPIWVYSHSLGCSVTGGYVYRGCAIPSLRGHYFFADYCNATIWSFPIQSTPVPAGSVTNRTAELAPGGGLSISSISSFGEDAAGELYICDMSGGEVFKIVPSAAQTTGIVSYGAGTPGCYGPHVLTASCPPTLNNPVFQVTCSNTLPGALGLGIVSTGSLPTGSDPFGVGVEVLVDMTTPGAWFPFFVPSPPSTFAPVPATVVMAIPNLPSLIGITVFVQEFWTWTQCTPSPVGASSSSGLALTFQP